MGKPAARVPRKTGGDTRRRLPAQAHVASGGATRAIVIDELECSFPLLHDEPHWLMALLADDLAGILADD